MFSFVAFLRRTLHSVCTMLKLPYCPKGLYGACFIRLTDLWSNVRQRLWTAKHPVVEVLVVAVATGLIAYLNQYTR